MIEVVTTLAILILALCIVMAAYRVFAGPSQPDRVIALEVIGTNVVGLIVVLVWIGGALDIGEVASVRRPRQGNSVLDQSATLAIGDRDDVGRAIIGAADRNGRTVGHPRADEVLGFRLQ